MIAFPMFVVLITAQVKTIKIHVEFLLQVTSPMALFFFSPEQRYLIPIAIQLFQEKGDDNPVRRNFYQYKVNKRAQRKKEVVTQIPT